MNLKSLYISVIILSIFTINTFGGWWPWSSEDEKNDNNVESLVDKIDEEEGLFNNEQNLNVDNVVDNKENIKELEDVIEATKEEHMLKSDEVESRDISLEEVKQLNKEAFEEKLDEVIKAHETLHLNKEVHFDTEGDHNDEYDHKAFLGDDAEEFKHLTPEESKDRLSKIFHLIDKDNDTLISEGELTIWIKETALRGVAQRTEEFWGRSNPEGKKELSWDEYRAIQYGFLTDGHITDNGGRWVDEDDVDPETLKIYKQLEQRDRRRWTIADRNKNLQLSKSEFSGFLHPEYEPHMSDVIATETMTDFDKDGDGKLNLAEYVLNVFGDTKNVADWESGGMQFRGFRDLNKDGFIDKEELKAWIHPEDYDQNQAESSHLIYEADRNSDHQLSKQEVLDSYTIFVSSQATDFGADLHNYHEEL